MQSVAINTNAEKKLSFAKTIKRKLLQIFRLTNLPVVKVYHGYGNDEQMLIFGHVLSLSPLPRKTYRRNLWTNAFALLRSFMVRRVPRAKVRLHWDNDIHESVTADDGFFRFEWRPQREVPPGVYKVTVDYYRDNGSGINVIASGTGSVIVAHENQYGFISDIDDTFLISHSSNLRRRLYVLFTKNAHSRKPFEGVVRHYRLLSNAHTDAHSPNPFFYVSSSEWNLYDFIKEFTRKNELPEGVFLLSQMKRFSEMWKTGGTRHATKFMRISRILEAYPTHRFVLLGDDSQMDPVIYSGIASYFKDRVAAVYLRHVYEKNISNVKELIKRMEAQGIPCCHFMHSRDAIEHSYRIGLIKEEREE